MSQAYQNLLLEIDETGVCLLTINRPDKMNALNNQVFEELDDALTSIKENNSIKGVIITGSGEKAFVAGADIKKLNTLKEEEAIKLSLRGQRVFQKIEDSTKPVIAAINGYALGGGCELAMACHIRVASQNALMGLPEVSLGLIPGYGGTQRLPKLVGQAKALELILSGRFVNAVEANEIGLVNLVADGLAIDATKKYDEKHHEAWPNCNKKCYLSH